MHHYLQLAWNETMYWGPMLTNKECSRSHYQTLLCIYLASGNIWGTWWSDTLHWSHLTFLGSNASDLSPSRFDPQRPHFGHWDLPLLPVLVLPLLPVSCRCVNACCQFCQCLAMLRGNLAKCAPSWENLLQSRLFMLVFWRQVHVIRHHFTFTSASWNGDQLQT